MPSVSVWFTSKGLKFVAGGKSLIGATEHNFKLNSHDQSIEYINGIALWNVYTGELIKCITYPCQGDRKQRDGFLGNVSDENGEWDAIFSEGILSISKLSDNTIIFDREINAIDDQYHWKIGSVAFDSQNHRYALVFQENRIYLSNLDRPLVYETLANGVKGDLEIVTDAQIDPSGHWLVIARGNKTQVLNLDNGKVLLQVEVSDPALSFDRTGKLLFVGSNNKLAVYSIETSEKISEYDAVGITSLSISDDNRIVIWGDIQGVVHIWAKPLTNP